MGFLNAVVVVVVLTAVHVNGSKFLLIPGAATSHCLEMMSIGHELLQRGHQVTLFPLLFDPESCLARFDLQQYRSEFKVVVPNIDKSFQIVHNDVMSRVQEMVFERLHIIHFLINVAPTMTTNYCNAMFYDHDVMKALDNAKFDMALVEAIPFTSCMFAMAVYLDIPTTAVGTVIDSIDSKSPLQSNILPHIFTEFSNEMSFTQRFANTMMSILTPVIRRLISPPIDLSQHSDRLKDIDTSYLIENAVLFLENSDYIVDYPKAIFPNFVQVGGLTAIPPKPLTGELKEFMDACSDGVAVVSFGSILKDIPVHLLSKLKAMLLQLNVQVIFKQDVETVEGNIRTMKWLPQNDLLGHTNTKLFISHCGKNGFWEAVFNGVPIVCMPVHAESPSTAVKVKKYQIGSSINIFDHTVNDMVQIVQGVLNNSGITHNMKRMASILKDRPQTPTQRAASAIEHVIKYGGDHMKPPSISFATYIYADVWLTLFAILLLGIVFDIWLIRRCIFNRIKKTRQNNKSKFKRE